MKHFNFPLLLLVRTKHFRRVTIGDGKFAVAFSTLERATAFMEATGESNWEFALLIRAGVPEIASDLQAAELGGICLDPAPDESGGTAIGIEEIRENI